MIMSLGVTSEVELIRIDTTETAVANRFLGSPTVHVNGVDIEPQALNRTDYGLACRRYGDSGVPPCDMISTALKQRKGELE